MYIVITNSKKFEIKIFNLRSLNHGNYIGIVTSIDRYGREFNNYNNTYHRAQGCSEN